MTNKPTFNQLTAFQCGILSRPNWTTKAEIHHKFIQPPTLLQHDDTILLFTSKYSVHDSVTVYSHVMSTIAVCPKALFTPSSIEVIKNTVHTSCSKSIFKCASSVLQFFSDYVHCCCCCLLQTTLSCQVTNTSNDFQSKNNSVVNVVASGAQILSKNCKHLYDCK